MLELKISSPASVVEGQSYSVRLTVTNQSFTAGIPTEAMLRISIGATVFWDTFVSEVLIPAQERQEYFSPSQTKTFDYTMNIPLGLGGYSGSIGASVMDPTGLIILDSASEPLVVEAVVPELADIYGIVTFRKTGARLPGVKVTIDTLVTYTDSLGRYAFEKLNPGSYIMTLEKEGYETLWDTVTIVAGDNEINAEMTLVPALIASLSGYITDSETGDAIVGAAEVTIVEHTGFMEANVYKTTSDTSGFYSLENMAFENKPIVVDISVEAAGYDLIKLKDVSLAEGENTRDFEMVWVGDERDAPRFISYQLPDQIVSGEEFPVSMTIYLPYLDEVFKPALRIQSQESNRIFTSVWWELLPATLYDRLEKKGDWIRFDSAGVHTLEAIGKAVYRKSILLGTFAPLPPGTYDIYANIVRYKTALRDGRLDYYPLRGTQFSFAQPKVGTVEII